MKKKNQTFGDRVIQVLNEQFDFSDEVLPTAHLEDDLDLDSLDIVELTMAIEEEFNIEITDEESEKFKLVSDINIFLMNYERKAT